MGVYLNLPPFTTLRTRFNGVDLEGTVYVAKNFDDDFLGFVFAYQVLCI